MKYQTPPQPRQLRLDTTTRCNASCLSCHRHISCRSGEMPWEMASAIILDAASWRKPLEELVPVNYGEALLYPYWRELFEEAQKYLPGTNIVLPTNGLLMIEENVRFLASIKTLKLVNFSINAANPETLRLLWA